MDKTAFNRTFLIFSFMVLAGFLAVVVPDKAVEILGVVGSGALTAYINLKNMPPKINSPKVNTEVGNESTEVGNESDEN